MATAWRNLLINPTLSDLVGGIESVTLSDEEARRRGTQKSVLERRAPPTFDVLIELQDRQRMAVHHSVAAAVDAILRGRSLQPEIRFRDESGQVRIEKAPAPQPESRTMGAGPGMNRLPFEKRGDSMPLSMTGAWRPYARQSAAIRGPRMRPAARAPAAQTPTGVSVRRGPRPADSGRAEPRRAHCVVDSLEQANAVVTLKNYYRKHPQPISDAERRRIPVYVLRANTMNQVEAILGDVFGLPVVMEDPVEQAVAETQEAIRRVLGGSNSEELRPAGADVRRMQHEMARAANLVSHSYGNEPRRRVRIFPG
jgi:hypothetical protein